MITRLRVIVMILTISNATQHQYKSTFRPCERFQTKSLQCRYTSWSCAFRKLHQVNLLDKVNFPSMKTPEKKIQFSDKILPCKKLKNISPWTKFKKLTFFFFYPPKMIRIQTPLFMYQCQKNTWISFAHTKLNLPEFVANTIFTS